MQCFVDYCVQAEKITLWWKKKRVIRTFRSKHKQNEAISLWIIIIGSHSRWRELALSEWHNIFHYLEKIVQPVFKYRLPLRLRFENYEGTRWLCVDDGPSRVAIALQFFHGTMIASNKCVMRDFKHYVYFEKCKTLVSWKKNEHNLTHLANGHFLGHHAI